MKCEIIRDLLPVYCDGLASEETRTEVENHLANCEECQETYKLMKNSVPEIPKPDIQPMKKIKRSLRLRLILVLGMICIGLMAGLYNMLVANPMAISSKNITVKHYSRRQDDNMYICEVEVRGRNREVCTIIPKDSEYSIDKQNDCVWVDGEKLVAGDIDGETLYATANGKLYPAGILTVNIECKTPFKCIRVDCTPVYNPFIPVEQEIILRPCLPFRQEGVNLFNDKNFRHEYEAISLGAGATITIKCRDKDVVIDLHKIAIEEGLLDE